MRIVVPTIVALGALSAVSAPAQTSQPTIEERATQVIVYGNDPCPRVTAGDQIIVCARRPERERYRIPEAFRNDERLRDSESWASRFESVEDAGETGIGSCSTVGPAGFTGCWEEMMQQYRKERRANPEPR